MRPLALFYHWFVTVVRVARGRWFVFRDRPDWFVNGVAETLEEDGDAPAATEWMQQAREEKALRSRKLPANIENRQC